MNVKYIQHEKTKICISCKLSDPDNQFFSFFPHTLSLSSTCFGSCRLAKTLTNEQQSASSLFLVPHLLRPDLLMTRSHHVSSHTTAKITLTAYCALTCNASRPHLLPLSSHYSLDCPPHGTSNSEI